MLLPSGMLCLGHLLARPLAALPHKPETRAKDRPSLALQACGGSWLTSFLLLVCVALWRLPAQSSAIEWGDWGRFLIPTAIGITGLILVTYRSKGLLTVGLLLFAIAQGIGKSAFRYEFAWPTVPSVIYDRVRDHEPLKSDLVLAVARTHAILKTHDPDGKIRLWYDVKEPAGLVYHSVAVASIFRNTNASFPVPDPAMIPHEGHQVIALFSRDPDGGERAVCALAPHANPRIISQQRVRTKSFDFWVWVLHVEPHKSK